MLLAERGLRAGALAFELGAQAARGSAFQAARLRESVPAHKVRGWGILPHSGKIPDRFVSGAGRRKPKRADADSNRGPLNMKLELDRLSSGHKGTTADDAMTGNVDEKTITAREEPFTVVREGWNEYILESGVRVRVKASIAKIGRQIDEHGNFTENRYGDPAVLVRYALEVVTAVDSDNATG